MTSDRDHTDLALGDELLAQILALLPARGLVCAEASCTHWSIARSGGQPVQTGVSHHRRHGRASISACWYHSADAVAIQRFQWPVPHANGHLDWCHLVPHTTQIPLWFTGNLEGSSKAEVNIEGRLHQIAGRGTDTVYGVQTVRLWDRKTGACRHILQLPTQPSALHLLSDELTVVICMISCSVWKSSRCLRSICPDLSVPSRVIKNSYICASAVSDNLLFLVLDGACTIQVWDLYSGLQVQIFRPAISDSSVGDYYITALAAGTVHGHQILLVGIGHATLSSWVLILHQSDGQPAASPIPLPSRRWVARIDYEDGVAVAIMQHIHILGMHSMPVPIYLSKAQGPGRQGRPAFSARSTLLAPVCSGPASDHITLWRQHSLAAAHSAAIPFLISIQRSTYPHPIRLKFIVMAEDEEGLRAKDWYRHCPAITRPETGSQGSESTPHNTLPADEGIVVHSCGLLLTTSFHHQVAVWQFPSFPDEGI